jgi:hypothetical protein
MTKASPEQLLADARAVFADDPDRSNELRREVIETGVSPAWSVAHMDLATQDYGQGDYKAAVDHAAAVLSARADLVDPAARAVAGIILCDAREALDQSVDETVLQESIQSSESTGHPYYAGSGLGQLARLRLRTGDRAAAKAALERSVVLFDQAGSMTGGPGALLRLANLEIEDKRPEHARNYLDQGIAYLKRFPLGGRSVRSLEQKLGALHDSIASTK